MIYFVAPRRGAWCIRNFLLNRGKPIRERIEQVFYEDLPDVTALPGGTYIFTALDQLSPVQRDLAAAVWDQLAAAGDAVRLLNDPRRVLRRTALLRTLAGEGINDFRAFPATDLPDDLRFPVFVREADQHSGLLSDVIETRFDLEVVLRAIRFLGFRLQDALVIEYLDTADADGVYWKYSAFFLDGHVLPRMANSSRHWNVKYGHLNDAHREAERAYNATNPHAEELAEIARLSGTDYGRVDYGLADGRVQVWEINTNPAFGYSPRQPRRNRPRNPSIEAGKAIFYEQFRALLCALDDRPAVDIPIRIEDDLQRRLRREQPAFNLVQAARFAGHKLLHSRKQPLPLLRKAVVPSAYGIASLMTKLQT